MNEWQAIGRILVQGYKMVSYFPLILSKAFIGYCLGTGHYLWKRGEGKNKGGPYV